MPKTDYTACRPDHRMMRVEMTPKMREIAEQIAALQAQYRKLGRVNTNGDGDDCARKSPTWRLRPNNSLPLNTACPGSVATSA